MAVKKNLLQWIEETTATVPDRGVTELALKIFNQIDAEMQNQGLTQTALAERAGVNRAFVSRILNNPSNVTLGTIMRLANALDLAVVAPRLQPRKIELEPTQTVDWWTSQIVDRVVSEDEHGCPVCANAA